jgi:hypothetical protein
MTRAKGLALLALFAGLLAAMPAIAADPHRTPFDSTFIDPDLSALCGAPVEVHLEGTAIDTRRNGIDSTRYADFTFTYTNLGTGRSAELRIAGLRQISSSLENGIYIDIYSFSGAGAHFFAEGEPGPLLINAGLVVETYRFDTNTGEFTYVPVRRGRLDEILTDEMICEAIP